MEDITDIYNDLIMEHSMNSYNKKKLDNPTCSELGHNPNCGDEIEIEIKLNKNIIEDMAFTGHGCAISQASTSIMIDTLKGKTVEEAKDIIKTFAGLRWLPTSDNKKLGKISRESVISEISSNGGVLYTIYGGKLTTYRLLSQEIGNRITKKFKSNTPRYRNR